LAKTQDRLGLLLKQQAVGKIDDGKGPSPMHALKKMLVIDKEENCGRSFLACQK